MIPLLPRGRGKTSQMKNEFWQISDEDFRMVALQIGRKPRGLRGIACRCPLKFPTVVVSEPIVVNAKSDDNEFFPTLFWLSCFQLRKKVAHLESTGLISRLEKLFALNLEFREALREAHAAYIQQRFGFIGREKYFALKEENHPWLYKILKAGVGGTENFKHLKCLHAHVAQQMAVNNNPAGRIVLDLILEPHCPPEASFCRRKLAKSNNAKGFGSL